MHDTLSECALQIYDVSLKYLQPTVTKLIEGTRNSIANDQREITPKHPKQSYRSCT